MGMGDKRLRLNHRCRPREVSMHAFGPPGPFVLGFRPLHLRRGPLPKVFRKKNDKDEMKDFVCDHVDLHLS